MISQQTILWVVIGFVVLGILRFITRWVLRIGMLLALGIGFYLYRDQIGTALGIDFGGSPTQTNSSDY